MLFSKKKKNKKEKKEKDRKVIKKAEKKEETISEVKAVRLPSRPIFLASKALIRPIVTEKATNLQVFNQYVFEVGIKTNKIEIKKAIKELYNVEPKEVKIVKVHGKQVRYGKAVGRTKTWKKAIISLKKGDKIEFTSK